MSSFIASVRINFSPLIQSLDIVATKSTCPFSRKTISSNFRKWQSRNVENIKVPRAVFSIAHAKRNSFVASSKSSKLVHCPTFCTTLHSLISGEILFICCCLCILLDMSRFLGQFGLTSCCPQSVAKFTSFRETGNWPPMCVPVSVVMCTASQCVAATVAKKLFWTTFIRLQEKKHISCKKTIHL